MRTLAAIALTALMAFAQPLGSSKGSAATVTTKYPLSQAAWTDLGAGPLLLSFTGNGGVFAISDTTPALGTEGFTKARGGSIRVITPSHVWGRTKDVYGVMAYVAPITAGGGGATSVWAAADAAANSMTLSNGGRTVAATTTAWQSIRGSIGKTSGKVYVEFSGASIGAPPQYTLFGLASSGFNVSSYLGTSAYSGGEQPFTGGIIETVGFSPGAAAGANPPVSNDVWALAVDFVGKVWVARNNVWMTGDPVAGTGAIMVFDPVLVGMLFPTLSIDHPGGGVWTLQPTGASQKYAPPVGFTPWN